MHSTASLAIFSYSRAIWLPRCQRPTSKYHGDVTIDMTSYHQEKQHTVDDHCAAFSLLDFMPHVAPAKVIVNGGSFHMHDESQHGPRRTSKRGQSLSSCRNTSENHHGSKPS
ncbi:hypothetical protein BJ165DRAFT_674389 [Panaeolus papilionaceus]|nr:hypothetical protein BJ165DRAFT_674389 [Panaeolus papilionaceus]